MNVYGYDHRINSEISSAGYEIKKIKIISNNLMQMTFHKLRPQKLNPKLNSSLVNY